jgi:hypothetical protein
VLQQLHQTVLLLLLLLLLLGQSCDAPAGHLAEGCPEWRLVLLLRWRQQQGLCCHCVILLRQLRALL